MKTAKLILLLIALFLVPVMAGAQTFTAQLTGAQVTPGPGDTDATGLAVVSINGTTVSYSIITTGLGTITSAAIRRGAGGDAVVTFSGTPVGGLLTGSQTIGQDLGSQIAGNPGAFYVEVRTSDFPNGAVRGSLAAPLAQGSRVLYVPVVGKVAGAAGTNFVTDARIVNRGTATANVTLEYFQQSASGQTAPTATQTFTVAPGAQQILDDVIGTLSTSGLGGLRIVSDQDVSASARVLNDLRASGQGTTGFAVNARELAGAGTSGTLAFLSNASVADITTGVGFRTNVGYFNPGASAASLTFTAHRSSDGSVLGSTTIAVPGFSFVQQGAFTLLNSVAGADQVQANFYITWTSSVPLFVYGSVVDNKTGDSVFID